VFVIGKGASVNNQHNMNMVVIFCTNIAPMVNFLYIPNHLLTTCIHYVNELIVSALN